MRVKTVLARVRWWHIGLLLALLLAFLSPLASSSPDGLERVAGDQGFIYKEREGLFTVMADYLFPGVGNEILATILAGLVGTLVLFGLTYGLGRLLGRQREH